jgi:uncharacterized zinc-type alcohol dehydrogenase-like protein
MIEGYAVHAAGAELHTYKYDPGPLQPNDVEILISHCGVCHSDVSLIDHEWGISQFPFIPGHEVVGTVAEVGSGVQSLKPGQRVGVGWQCDSCGHCEWCLRGVQEQCAKAALTCVGRNGGFADRIRVNARFAIPMPEALDSETAAPLLCAGNTVYSPLRLHGVNPSSRVGILGIGGLGHLAIQFARAFGAEVTAFSSSAEKQEEALGLGAHHFVNTRESKALKSLAGSFDLILSTISGDGDWKAYVQALRPKGSLVFTGIPKKPASFAVMPMILQEQSVAGARATGPARIAEMLDVAARHNIRATIERFDMRDANLAVEKARKGAVRYRAVLAN